MSVQNKTTLKGYFKVGDEITAAHLADLIDSLNAEVGTAINAALTAADTPGSNNPFVVRNRLTIDVRDFESSGPGAVQAAVDAAPEGSSVLIASGEARHIESPIRITKRLNLVGQGTESILINEGTGRCIEIDGTGKTGANAVWGARVSHLTIFGLAGSGDGVYMKNTNQNYLEDVHVVRSGGAGIHCHASILNTFVNCTVSTNWPNIQGIGGPAPSHGFLGTTENLSGCNANTFIGFKAEGVGTGVQLPDDSISNVFIGGSSEGNTIGVQLGDVSGTSVHNNCFIGFHLEANGTDWVTLEGSLGRNVILGQYDQHAGDASPQINLNYLKRLLLDSGGLTDLSIKFNSDRDTGFYNPAANTMMFAAGGAQVLSLRDFVITAFKTLISASNDVDLGSAAYGKFRDAVLSGKALAAGGLGVGNTAANTNTPSGATARAMPVYDANGSLLGYIPIYAAQW